MDATGPRTPAAANPPSGRGGGAALTSAVHTVLRAPLTHRAWAELLYCLISVPFGVAAPASAVGLVVALGMLGPGPGKPDNVSIAGMAFALLILVVLAPPLARWPGRAYRRLAASLLGESIAAPPPFRSGRGILGWPVARLRDRTGWRAVAYLLVKPPLVLAEAYALIFWVTGLINLSSPVWWALFRNHPPNVRLSPVPVATPLGERTFEVATNPGTLLSCAVGAVTLLAAPWVTRAVTSVDRWLIRALLGPGRLVQRIRDLEETRARAVDDSAAMLRRLERDLHDGAQIRLATLAMNLGMAKEKLGEEGEPDLAQIRELVDTAHKGAKDALQELRDLARGIHPPALDVGLADALATLAAGSAIPAELTTDITERPTPAIETIAYFCAAELLANAAKHSRAGAISIRVAGRNGMLLLTVTDDGVGGARSVGGGGLAGLAQRAGTVDGRLHVASPPGGPTQITVELPLRA